MGALSHRVRVRVKKIIVQGNEANAWVRGRTIALVQESESECQKKNKKKKKNIRIRIWFLM